MDVSGYLIINEHGGLRATKRRPALADNEIAIELTLDVPRTPFQRPALRAVIVLSEAQPIQLTAEVMATIADAIRAATDMPISLELVGLPDGR